MSRRYAAASLVGFLNLFGGERLSFGCFGNLGSFGGGSGCSVVDSVVSGLFFRKIMGLIGQFGRGSLAPE